MSRQIVLLLPTECLNSLFEQMIQRSDIQSTFITRISDFSTLSDRLHELKPDLVIASPVIISDPLLPLFKQETELSKTRFLAVCTNHLETSLINHYDAKITITDTSAEMIETITNALELDPDTANENSLTAREKDVVIAVVKGLSNKEIADELFLSTHTVMTHRRNIARKLNIHSASGLTIYAIMNKLVSLEDISH